jgi:hypothetical protein
MTRYKSGVQIMNKKSFTIALVLGVSASLPALAAPTCLNTRLIQNTKLIDAKTIDFRMKNGVVYRNAMRFSCAGLKFNGFINRGPDGRICARQTIRVLQSQQVCALGNFSKLSPPVAQTSN